MKRSSSSKFLLAVALIVLGTTALACRGHYREVARSPSPAIGIGEPIALVGVRTEATAQLDPEASARLATASGLELRDVDIAPEQLATLLGDPALLLVASAARKELRTQLGHRYALIGDVLACPVEERSRWGVIVPVPPWNMATFLVGLGSFPITYARRTEVPHAAVLLRVVDLDSGRVQSEFFAVSNSQPGKAGLSENIMEAGLQAVLRRSRQ